MKKKWAIFTYVKGFQMFLDNQPENLCNEHYDACSSIKRVKDALLFMTDKLMSKFLSLETYFWIYRYMHLMHHIFIVSEP